MGDGGLAAWLTVRPLVARQLCRPRAQGGVAEPGRRHGSPDGLYDLHLECRRTPARVSLADYQHRHHRLPRLARGDAAGAR